MGQKPGPYGSYGSEIWKLPYSTFNLLDGRSARVGTMLWSRPDSLTPQEQVNVEWNAMAGEWDDLAAEYAAGFERLLWNHLGGEQSQPLTVVDFGCGTGLLTERLQSRCSKIIAIDAAPKMIDFLIDKVQSRDWENVRALCLTLAHLNESDKKVIDDLSGTVDLIVASSVLTFIPPSDLEATMQVLGGLLKPNGLMCHSDWPMSEAHRPDAMTEDKAQQIYALAGLNAESMHIVPMDDKGETFDIFFGVARKPAS